MAPVIMMTIMINAYFMTLYINNDNVLEKQQFTLAMYTHRPMQKIYETLPYDI